MLLLSLDKFRNLIKEAAERGGLTVGLNKSDYLKIKEYKSGFMVGGYSKVYTQPAHDAGRNGLIDFYYNALKLEAEVLRSKATSDGVDMKSYCLGLWVDNGLMYLELSKHIRSKEEAIQEAKRRDQLAVYDCKNNKSIYL